MISSGALRTFARRAASSTTARRFASSGAGAGGAESQSAAQQTAAYITAGALVVSMTCVSQAGKKVRTTCMRPLDMCVYFGGVYDMYLSAAHAMLETERHVQRAIHSERHAFCTWELLAGLLDTITFHELPPSLLSTLNLIILPD